MKLTKKPEHLPALLPGFEWSATVEKVEDRNDTPERHGRWWVRSSAQQKLCPSTGQPLGFRHSLMQGSQVARSGVGADAARALTAQAEFLNHCAPGGTTQPCDPCHQQPWHPLPITVTKEKAGASSRRSTIQPNQNHNHKNENN